jgi:hypothetical protein
MVVLAVAALCGSSAQAKTVAAGSRPEGAHTGHHSCRCAERCRGAACCCKHDRPAPPKPAAPTSSTLIATGPCLAALPCDGAAPVPTTSGPLVRIVDLARLGAAPFLPACVTSRVAPSPLRQWAAVVPARLEDPPEGIVS